MSDSGGDKKHSASERKRRKAREDGQVAKSQDLASAALLLVGLAAMWMLGGDVAEHMAEVVVEGLSDTKLGTFVAADARSYLGRMSGRLAIAVVPLMLAITFAGIFANVMQTGLILSTKKLMPKLSNVSPLSGAKKLFSLQGVMRLLFGLFKVAIVTVVAYIALQTYRDPVFGMAAMTAPQIAKSMFECLMGTCIWIGAALFILAILEWAYQKWKFENDLKMTDQEVRDEMKETEGNPETAKRRRQVQQQLAMNRIAADVPQADVVNTNPTELAIAIKYDPTSMPAPIVVAKGAGAVAQRIRRLALEHEVPVVERKELAQFLYKNVEVGQEIPPEQYEAVAEMLRYVYELKGKSLPQAAAA